VFGHMFCGIGGVFAGLGVFLRSNSHEPTKKWLDKFCRKETRKNQRVAVALILILMGLAYFLNGAAQFAIAPTQSFWYGVVMNSFFGFLAAMSFCGCAICELVKENCCEYFALVHEIGNFACGGLSSGA
jgi:hypothetical protein